MYLGDLSCRVQCLCETVSVYVQGRDHGYRTPGPLTLNRTVCVCVYLPSSCWGPCMPGVVLFPSVTIALFFVLFFPCTDVNMMNWKLLDGDPTHLSSTRSPDPFPPWLMLSGRNKTRRQKTGRWNLRCPNDSSIRSINTPVGCVFRWLWWRH